MVQGVHPFLAEVTPFIPSSSHDTYCIQPRTRLVLALASHPFYQSFTSITKHIVYHNVGSTLYTLQKYTPYTTGAILSASTRIAM